MSGPAMLVSLTCRLLPVALSALLGLLSCGRTAQQIADGPDPMEALGSPAASGRYTVEFWAREAHGKSDLWRRATAFCRGRDHAAFPNCDAVRIVTFWEAPPPFPRPRYTFELPGEALPPAMAPPAPRQPASGGRP
jgi:hypothetical protein